MHKLNNIFLPIYLSNIKKATISRSSLQKCEADHNLEEKIVLWFFCWIIKTKTMISQIFWSVFNILFQQTSRSNNRVSFKLIF